MINDIGMNAIPQRGPYKTTSRSCLTGRRRPLTKHKSEVMSMKATISAQIRVPGLQKLDILEMSEQFPQDAVTFADEVMPGSKHGELAATAVIVLTALSIKALATWLLKNRTRNRINRRVEVVDTSGAKHIETIDIDLSSSLSPQADVMKELSKITGFDVTNLLEKPE